MTMTTLAPPPVTPGPDPLTLRRRHEAGESVRQLCRGTGLYPALVRARIREAGGRVRTQAEAMRLAGRGRGVRRQAEDRPGVPAPPSPACLHCGGPAPQPPGWLCAACAARRSVRRLYLRSKRWTPEWEVHLRRLAERARLRLPLFE